jgi:guanylate kinase
LSRSWTTRRPRPAEPPDAYTFVDRAKFETLAKAGGFLEWASVLGELYGTPLPDPPAGSDLVLEIDVQGAGQVLERCEDVVCILVVPPSEEAQSARMRGRGDPERRAEERLALGRQEIEVGRSIADYVVVNDDLERAVAEVEGILQRERAARRA